MAEGGDAIAVTRVDVEPAEPCPVDARLALRIAFSAPRALRDASWTVSYVVDAAGMRHVVELGGTPHVDYEAGPNEFRFEAEKVDVAGLKKRVLLNMGLLSCLLRVGQEEVLEVKLVTQVSKGRDGELVRVVFNPLEQ